MFSVFQSAASRRVLGVGIAACLALAAVSTGGPARAVEGVQPAFNALVRALESAQGAGTRGGPARAEVNHAAQALENAILADGGARKTLMAATKTIVASLENGHFNAQASLTTLRGIAPDTVIDPGPWRPGPVYPQEVGINLHQKAEGDCVGISALKAFSSTEAGESILRRAVSREANAPGYVVNLPGAPKRVFHVRNASLAQYGIGDPAAAAIIGALFQYFDLDPHHASLPTNKVMELLAGNEGRHARLADNKASPQEIENFLMQSAPRVGVDVAMVFGGKPGQGGDWSRGDGHAFAILRIDAASHTVFYTNPWNEGRVRTIAIADLAKQAAGTTADFETVAFREAGAQNGKEVS